MEITLSKSRLGTTQLFNHCNDKYCSLGAGAKAAGVEDEAMDGHRSSLIFRETDELNEQGQTVVGADKKPKVVPPRDLPEELAPFFVEDENFNNCGLRPARRFTTTVLGAEVAAASDTKDFDAVTEAMARGGFTVTWED